jgi:hypothetical protein
VRIDGAAINVLGLKLVIGLKTVHSVLEGVQSPDGLSDGIPDRGLGIRIQQGADSISGNEHGVKRWMSAMLIKPLEIRPSAPTFLGRRRPFGANTHRIHTPGIPRQHGFEANITLPIRAVIIDIPEVLPATETKGAQLDVSGIRPVAPKILAVHVKRVEMLAAPGKHDLEDRVQVRKGGVAADEEATPDERTDPAQDDAELIDAGRFR